MSRLKKLFYTSFIGNIYFSFLLWLDRVLEKRRNKKLDFTTIQIVKQTKQMYYDQGIKQIKDKINMLVNTKDTSSYRKILKETEDLISLANLEEQDRQQVAEALYKIAVVKGQDIKNDLDLAKMVDKRINDYKELQNYKLNRELLKQIRAAQNSGDKELANSLLEEWRSKYGRFRRN